ncbi:hypothetical protein AB0E59_42455 [Lentzea sp. NPDC034063]|uniref:hypothetical protein n=1 Tax=unclassified Lentzea TaxID=2643253 RepID=UPI0033C8EED0
MLRYFAAISAVASILLGLLFSGVVTASAGVNGQHVTACSLDKPTNSLWHVIIIGNNEKGQHVQSSYAEVGHGCRNVLPELWWVGKVQINWYNPLVGGGFKYALTSYCEVPQRQAGDWFTCSAG